VVPGLFDGPDLGFCEGLACVWKEKFGFIHQKGELQIPYRFQLAEHFSEGLAVVRTPENTSGPFGFLNKQGEVAVEDQFAHAYSFEGGLARVAEGETWGYRNHDGDYVWKDQEQVTNSRGRSRFSRGANFPKILGRTEFMALPPNPGANHRLELCYC